KPARRPMARMKAVRPLVFLVMSPNSPKCQSLSLAPKETLRGVGRGAEKGNLRLTPGETLAVSNGAHDMRAQILCGINGAASGAAMFCYESKTTVGCPIADRTISGRDRRSHPYSRFRDRRHRS